MENSQSTTSPERCKSFFRCVIRICFAKTFLKEAPMEAVFKSMDKDGDGFVTKEVILDD